FSVVASEVVPGWIFGSGSLDGPWTFDGAIGTNAGAFCSSSQPACLLTSNLTITVGPDNRFWATSRHGQIMDSDTIAGTYKVETTSIYPSIPGMNWNNAEDPVIWYSGGYYHVIFNFWDARKAYHLMSVDGVNDWQNTGLAYDPTTDFIRYTDGTVNHWHNVERPGVYLENGHVTHFTFAVTDINKDGTPKPSASKVIVVPFDGIGFDADNGGEKPSDAGLAADTSPEDGPSTTESVDSGGGDSSAPPRGGDAGGGTTAGDSGSADTGMLDSSAALALDSGNGVVGSGEGGGGSDVAATAGGSTNSSKCSCRVGTALDNGAARVFGGIVFAAGLLRRRCRRRGVSPGIGLAGGSRRSDLSRRARHRLVAGTILD
ncbi:MAG: hypothetical protein JOZ69_03860, partial [Myxococcales bacterium]|nr:hypothetical protein [Myxococcales bacterium]